MAALLYSTLSEELKRKYRYSTLVLLRFKVPLDWFFRSVATSMTYPWNRHYTEYNWATHEPLRFSIRALQKLEVFAFNTTGTFPETRLRMPTENCWSTPERTLYQHTVGTFTALLDCYMRFTVNWVYHHHLIVPTMCRDNYELRTRNSNSEAVTQNRTLMQALTGLPPNLIRWITTLLTGPELRETRSTSNRSGGNTALV